MENSKATVISIGFYIRNEFGMKGGMCKLYILINFYRDSIKFNNHIGIYLGKIISAAKFNVNINIVRLLNLLK